MFNLPRNSFNLAFIDLSFSLGYFCFPDRVIVLIVVLKWYIAASLSYHILQAGLSLSTRGESLSFLEQGGCSGGRVWFGGSKCPLKDIRVISQIHEDGSLSKRYR